MGRVMPESGGGKGRPLSCERSRGPRGIGEGDRKSWDRGANIFSDGSLLENGNVGGGAFIVSSRGAEVVVESKIGNVATVWDSEVTDMADGLARVRREKKVLILADSKAAIAAVRKAGRTGKARSRDLQRVVNVVVEIKEGRGGEVKLGWVKAHMGILGNEAADVLAKRASERVPVDDHEKWITGGGIRQWAKRRKQENVGEEGV